MQESASLSSKKAETVVIGYSSPDAGRLEFTANSSLIEGGVEVTYIVAMIYLIKALTALVKISQAKS